MWLNHSAGNMKILLRAQAKQQQQQGQQQQQQREQREQRQQQEEQSRRQQKQKPRTADRMNNVECEYTEGTVSLLLDVSPPSSRSLACALCFSWPLLPISLFQFLSWPLPVLILRCSCPPQIHSLRIPLAQLVASHSPAHSPGHTYSHSHITILSTPLLPSPSSSFLQHPFPGSGFYYWKIAQTRTDIELGARRSLKSICYAGCAMDVQGIHGVCVILATVEVVARTAKKGQQSKQ